MKKLIDRAWVSRSLFGLALLALTLGGAPQAVSAQDIAVVVHPSNPLSDISLRDLERLYLGDANSFPGGGNATTYEEAGIREAFYKAAVDMSISEIQRHWIQATFSGGGAVAPRELAGAPAALAAVSGDPSGIAILPASAVDGSVKVVSVGGASPGDAGYPLN